MGLPMVFGEPGLNSIRSTGESLKALKITILFSKVIPEILAITGFLYFCFKALENLTYALYPRLGRPMEFIDPNSRSAYLGSGFPSRDSRVHDFIVIADDLDLPITSSSFSVTSAGPAALKMQVSNFTPAISVEISAILGKPHFLRPIFWVFCPF